jgi:hypothetical protein
VNELLQRLMFSKEAIRRSMFHLYMETLDESEGLQAITSRVCDRLGIGARIPTAASASRPPSLDAILPASRQEQIEHISHPSCSSERKAVAAACWLAVFHCASEEHLRSPVPGIVGT